MNSVFRDCGMFLLVLFGLTLGLSVLAQEAEISSSEWTNIQTIQDIDESAVFLLESVVDPIDNWSQLTSMQKTEYVATSSSFLVASIVILKISLNVKERLAHRLGFRFGRLLGSRSGPLEPYPLPTFVITRFFEDLMSSVDESSDLSRRQKKELKKRLRQQAIQISTGLDQYEIKLEALRSFDEKTWLLWKRRLEGAYLEFREAKLNMHWNKMPKLHHKKFEHETPYTDETLKAVIDITMDELSLRQQKSLIRLLENYAFDFTRSNLEKKKKSLSLSVRRFIREHRQLFNEWEADLKVAVRQDEGIRAQEIMRLQDRRTPVDEDSLFKYRFESYRRFLGKSCLESLTWLRAGHLVR